MSMLRTIRRAMAREQRTSVASMKCPKCGRALKHSGLVSKCKCRNCGFVGKVVKKQ